MGCTVGALSKPYSHHRGRLTVEGASCSSPGGARGGEGISRGATKQNTKNVWSRLGAL